MHGHQVVRPTRLLYLGQVYQTLSIPIMVATSADRSASAHY